jgi:enoyl-CoA hydratase
MIESQSPYIVCERPSEHAILIRLARPAKRNALNNAMVIELGRILDEATLDFSVRCVVIAGDDIAFSAGADIAEISAKGAGAVNDPRRVAAWRAIERFRKPLIAAINGIAFGAGNELAMTCDIIIAGRTARFGAGSENRRLARRWGHAAIAAQGRAKFRQPDDHDRQSDRRADGAACRLGGGGL